MDRGSRQSRLQRDWWSSMILSLPVIKIFYKIYACNLVCRLELHVAFPYIICQKKKKKSLKVGCFYNFQPKSKQINKQKSAFAYSLCTLPFHLNISIILSECLHYDVIMTSNEAGCYFLILIKRGAQQGTASKPGRFLLF